MTATMHRRVGRACLCAGPAPLIQVKGAHAALLPPLPFWRSFS